MTKRSLIILFAVMGIALIRSDLAWAKPGDVFYLEDFSGVKRGSLPRNWSGGQSLLVDEERGRKFARVFNEQDEDSVAVSEIRFPTSYRLEFLITCPWRFFEINVGNHAADFHDFHGTRRAGNVARVSIVSEGPIERHFVDDAEVWIGRVGEASPPSGFSFKWNDSNMHLFRIWRIKGTEL